MNRSWQVSRRTVLRGIGTAISLPLLEAMTPALRANAAAPAAPRRMAVLYVPNGVHMQNWTPDAEGADFALKPTLEPLAKFKDDMLVLTGLTCDKARPNGDGAGDHARSLSAFLTGAQAKKTHGADIKVGISADQIAADKVGAACKFPSIELGCEPNQQSGNCDSGYSCAYSSNISWRTESTPVAKEINPRLMFERLFGESSSEMNAARAAQMRRRKSVLDFVLDDASSLRSRLGLKDQRKMDEYLSSVRALERRVSGAAVEKPNFKPEMARPDGIPQDYAEHIRLMGDLLVLAFQGDLTRVATFVLANEGSNRSYAHIEVPEGHHDLSHHGGDAKKHEKISKINRFHIEQFAYILDRLKNTREGEGSLLDSSMLIYGSGISDGNRHNHDNLPILVAGRGGGSLKPGRHVRYEKNTPLNNLYLSLLDRMDAKTEHLGDSTGRLANLDG